MAGSYGLVTVRLITVIPGKVRVSIGTAAVLGLKEVRLATSPTTAYLMLYTEGSCLANCAFCAQARGSSSDKSHLSRVMWPEFSTGTVLEGFRDPKRDVLERICIQIINYPGFVEDTLALLEGIREVTELPLSLDTCPIDREDMERMREAGIEKVSIPLDASTPEIFDEIKGLTAGGPYRWEKHIEAIREAVSVFGAGNVMSNIIVGLGETEEEAARLIQDLMDLDVKAVLFAFTPLPGTSMSDRPQPSLESYRRIQLARHLIIMGEARYDDMAFSETGQLVSYGDNVDPLTVLGDGTPLKTTGCPGCNRPYYNERPSGPLYNYPRDLTMEELNNEKETIKRLIRID